MSPSLPLPASITSRASAVADELLTLPVLARSGIVAPLAPPTAWAVMRAIHRHGLSASGICAASAARFGKAPAIVDELGTLSYRELDKRTNCLARSLRARGVGEGGTVAILCRNHRGLVEAVLGAGKVGATVVLLNTGFSGPQLADVARRERVSAVVYDEEFADLVDESLEGRLGVVAWSDDANAENTLTAYVEAGDDAPVDPPRHTGRIVLLTSGTTGTPKGAPRDPPKGLGLAGAILSKIPLRAREPVHVAAPMFHALGFAHTLLGLVMGGSLVLRRRFEPEAALAATADHGCGALIVVPVMLRRMLDLPAATRSQHDLRKLRIVHATGSAMGAPLARRALDELGDVVYSLYGSTEVAWATIATPTDLRAEPGCAGRAPRGTVVKLLDGDGHEVPTGDTGRIFVRNAMTFGGYTDDTNKQVLDGLMSTGDVGHFDDAGRLFVDGRDDEMIVSGGENVFPHEVEDLLDRHDAIADVAVVGVSDDEFGQRLKAFVVLRDGATLDADGVRAHVKANLARYKVPRDVDFVDELPRNETGKVLKRELR